MLYFLPHHEGFSCISVQRLDPIKKRPQGQPRVLKHFYRRQRIFRDRDSEFGYAMTADPLYLPLNETKGNIWLAEPQDAR